MYTPTGGTTVQSLPKTPRRLFIEDIASRYPVPIDWKDGPLIDLYRRPTDTFCLILFLLFVCAMAFTGIWAFANSGANPFTKIYDSSRNVCGEGAAKDHPILYMQTFSKPYRSVCVAKCPEFDYAKMMGANNADPIFFKQFSKTHAGNSYTYNTQMSEMEAFDYPSFWANNQFSRDQWNNYLANYRVDCLPNVQVPSCQYGPNFYVYDSYKAVRNVCVPLSPKAALLFNKVNNKFSLGLLEDIAEAVPIFGWVALIALGVGLIVLILIYAMPKQALWVPLLFAVISILLTAHWIFNGLYGSGYLNNPINPLRVKYLQFWIEYKPILIALGVLAIVAAIILIAVVVRYRNYLDLASPFINYAAKNTLTHPLIIAISVFILILQIAVFFLGLYVIARLFTTGVELSDPASGAPFIAHQTRWWVYALAGLFAFGTFWILAVLNNLMDFIVSGVVVDHYFNSNIKPLHVLCHTLGYHLGTIAMTVFVFPLTLLKLVFGLFDSCLTSANPNSLQNAGRTVCSGCCWFYENFVESFSERFMPITYIGCVDYCPANRIFYGLSEIYADQVKVLLGLGDILSLCGRIIMTVIPALIGYHIYKSSIVYQQNIDNLWILWIGMAIIAYFTGSVFVNLFSQTYDSVLVCHLIEMDLKERGVVVRPRPKIIQDALAEYNARALAYNTGYRPLS